MKLKQLAALLLALTLLVGCGAAEPQTETTEAPTDVTEAPTEGPVSGYGENDVTALSDYAVLDTSANSELMRQVVAVNADGEACLDNAVLQICYWIEFYNFMSSYGTYAAYFGLDYTKPLAQQASLTENRTWEQYFLEAAALHYSQNYALAQAAYASGYELSAENAELIDDLADPNGNFAEEYKAADFDSGDDYLQANFGKGVCVEDYQNYLRIYYAAYDYITNQQAAYSNALTADEIEAYYDQNAATFEDNRVLKCNNVTVRHILIQPEGEKDTTTNDWTADAWTAAEKTANDVYAEWQNDPTEENFAVLANEYSVDDGSNTVGGIYEDFATNAMTETFSDWCFDAARVAGDHGIVKSPFGYHIMYFVGQTETRAWFDAAKEEMVNNYLSEEIDAQCKEHPLQFDYTLVRLYDLITANTAADDSASTDGSDTGSSEKTGSDSTESSEESLTSNG